MPTPITNATHSFTYNIADNLYAKTNLMNRTASASYTGPDRVWVFVDETTGNFSRISPPLTSQDDGADVPVPAGHVRVEITAADDTMIIAMLLEELVTYEDTSLTTESLPDPYGTLSFNATATLSQTYDVDDLSYDIEASTWRPLNYIDAPQDWDDVINHRNGALTGSDGKISPDMPDSVKQPWIDFRQALRDLPSVYGYGTDSEVEAWKVKFPEHPEEQ